MKDLRQSSSTYTDSLFLHVVKHHLLFLFFFSIWHFFHDYSRFTGQQVKEEAISLYPFYHFHPFHRHLDISWVITAKSSPLRTAGSRKLLLLEKCLNSGNTMKYFSCLIKSKGSIIVMFKESSCSSS